MTMRMRTLLDSSASNLSLHCKGALSWNYQVGHDDDDIDIFDDDDGDDDVDDDGELNEDVDGISIVRLPSLEITK